MQGKFLMTLAAALIVAGTGTVQAQQLIMKLTYASGNDIAYEWQKKFKAGVESRTAGRMKVDLFNFNQLGPIPRQVEGVVLGTIECSLTAVGFLTGLDRRFQLPDMAGIASNIPDMIKRFGDPAVRSRILEFGADKGVVTISAWPGGQVGVVSRQPIRTLAEFKGKKVRTPPSAAWLEPIKYIGATPTPLDLAEVTGALQTGAIDGSLSGAPLFPALKYYDAAKYITLMPYWHTSLAVVCNKAWMAALPADIRTIILEEAAKADDNGPAVVQANVDSSKIWEQNGGQYIVFSADDQKAFLEGGKAALLPYLTANPEVKAEYDFITGVAK